MTSPILTGSPTYAKLKTFFFFERDDTHFLQFSKLPNISKNVLGPKSKQKSEPKERRHFSEKNAIFFFPNKTQKYGNFEIELERVSHLSKKYILQLICVKKDCFYPIQVLEMKFLNFLFISQRPKNWLKFPNKTWFFQVWTSFQLELGAARWNLNMVFRGNMGKNVLFLACRSVRNSFLKFLVHVLGPQTCPPRAKKQ